MRYIFFTTALLVFFAAAFPAAAAAPKSLGKFGFWNAYSVTDGKDSVCYMTLVAHPPQPAAAAGKKPVKRADINMMITHRPAETTSDVFSYAAGTKFKPASEAVAGVGKRQFSLFTQADTAWSRDPNTDHAIAAAIRGSDSMTLTGTSSKDTLIADTIQLKGALAAYKAISKACGINLVDVPKTVSTAVKPQKKLPLAKTH